MGWSWIKVQRHWNKFHSRPNNILSQGDTFGAIPSTRLRFQVPFCKYLHKIFWMLPAFLCVHKGKPKVIRKWLANFFIPFCWNWSKSLSIQFKTHRYPLHSTQSNVIQFKTRRHPQVVNPMQSSLRHISTHFKSIRCNPVQDRQLTATFPRTGLATSFCRSPLLNVFNYL